MMIMMIIASSFLMKMKNNIIIKHQKVKVNLKMKTDLQELEMMITLIIMIMILAIMKMVLDKIIMYLENLENVK